MAPRNQPAKATLEEMVAALTSRLDTIIDRLDAQDQRFSKLERLLEATSAENTNLREDLANKDSEIHDLKLRVQNIEQHSRAYSIRVFNLDIDGNANDSENVARQVYTKALLPILQGAVDDGRLADVPTCSSLIEMAHTLPGKPGKRKPVIVRFYKRHHRTILMQCRKAFAPRSAEPAGSSSASSTSRPRPFLYPMYKDLTSEAFKLMRSLSSNPAVTACWSAGGVLRYRLRDDESDTIHRVSCVLDSAEDIIASHN